MALDETINSIITNLTNAYLAAQEKGAELPAHKNLANLAEVIGSLSAGGWEPLDDSYITIFENNYDVRDVINEMGDNGVKSGFYLLGNEYAIVYWADYHIDDRLNQEVYREEASALALSAWGSGLYHYDRGYTTLESNGIEVIGRTATLSTTAKNTLVAAINEINSGKQTTLTAGEGIKIENGIISLDYPDGDSREY